MSDLSEYSAMSTLAAQPGSDDEVESAVNDAKRKEGIIEAERILRSGKPFEYFLKTFQLDHEGDLTAARVMALSFASSAVINGDGLHTYLSGNSGRGKSHAAETMMKQLPARYRYNRAFSDKYLYYASNGGGLSEGAVIMVDDQTMTTQIQELFKVAVSNFREGVQYGTVMNQKALTLVLPPRISWILLKVDDPGDDQVMNRLIQARIDESDDKIRASAKKIQEKYCNLNTKVVRTERQEIKICRNMWAEIKGNPVAVEVPCAGHVRFYDYHNLRNHELFFNLVMSHAVIHQFQRPVVGYTVDGEKIIEATYEDYKEAKLIFEALYHFGGQRFNTLRAEDAVINALLSMDLRDGENYFTIKDLSTVTGMNDREIRRALNGRKGKDGNLLGGLLSKCPHIVRVGNLANHETKVEYNQRGQSDVTSKRTWNQEVYLVHRERLEKWRRDGIGEPVWIDHYFQWK